ncbi:thiamine pyrophosphate-binding protein [Acidocella sp.]|uniref:thiamine pyrophosphate-binding protein n=1 Tax=Acidocella sp. TaxID=50710 RepID=UPI003CFE5C9A
MRVADYIASLVVAHGITDFFSVTGGGAMHLNDAFARNRQLRGVCLHHEQACAMAAEAYCRLSGRLALVNVTTGPGGINALNGVHGAWTDSIGMLVISGQVKQETMATSYDLPLRQLGDQEADIVGMVRGITKFAVVLRDKEDVRYVVEKAIYLARTGRPGPVWIDVPMDIQGAQIETSMLRGYSPEASPEFPDISEIADILRNARRPVIMPGTGVRIAGAYDAFVKLIDLTNFPVATAFNAHDLLAEEHPSYVGRPGTVGDRAGNFAVQNADVVLILGCRLNIRQISYNWENFAPEALKIMVDIDQAELAKPTLNIQKSVCADLKDFIPRLVQTLGNFVPSEEQGHYLDWCQERRRLYPVMQSTYEDDSKGINPYVFADNLFGVTSDNDVIVTANATACVTTFQAAKLKPGQRMFSNSGSASMGYDLPAAIGAAIAAPERRIICLSGDGSFMMNMQEMQSIIAMGLNIKIFLLNNEGYSSIKQTQSAFFPDNMFGCDAASGVTFPNFSRVAAAFGFEPRCVDAHAALSQAITETLITPGPQFCEVMLNPTQGFAPKLSSRKLDDGRMVSSPLHDMAPFLSREELAQNMWSDT